MIRQIEPSLLGGSIPAIVSKSDAHRLLICAALADAPTRLRLSSRSEDIEATLRCLIALGARAEKLEADLFQIYPLADVNGPCLLDCGESGSTLRFLLPLAAALRRDIRFIGHGRLPSRPLEPLLSRLIACDAQISGSALPLETHGGLRGGDFLLPGDVSSQYISGLLFALPLLPEESRILLTTAPQSRPYIEMTLACLRRFGICIRDLENGWQIPGGQRYRSPREVTAEGDWSNAAFWLCAGALGKKITVTNLSQNSLQGDRQIVSLLRRFGAEVTQTAAETTVCPAPLKGIAIDASQIPDLVPVLSVVACAAEGQTEIYNAGRLRLKESDRLSAISGQLQALGGRVIESQDSLLIKGCPLVGGKVSGYHDHRMVMAAAIAALRCSGAVQIDGAEAVQKSYPGFFEDYERLGGHSYVIDAGR